MVLKNKYNIVVYKHTQSIPNPNQTVTHGVYHDYINTTQ